MQSQYWIQLVPAEVDQWCYYRKVYGFWQFHRIFQGWNLPVPVEFSLELNSTERAKQRKSIITI